MEIRYIKSAARVLNRDCVNKGDLDIYKNILWVSVGQRAVDLRAVKVGGQKKFLRSVWCGQSGFESGRSAKFFFNLWLWLWPEKYKLVVILQNLQINANTTNLIDCWTWNQVVSKKNKLLVFLWLSWIFSWNVMIGFR